MNFNWAFPPTGGGQRYGLNDAGISLFSDDSVKSMVRESIQNSLDAHDLSENPVEVTFESLSIPTADFPGRDELRAVINRCRRLTEKSCDGDAKKFQEQGSVIFDTALGLLDAPATTLLRVSDFNTTGLKGTDADHNSAWDRLIRQQGAPVLHGVGGGSYGIGQRAPFAASRLRTVFYSTRTDQGAAFIGKSIWRSFLIDKDWHQHIGFGGRKAEESNEILAITDPLLMPKWATRDKIGTDLFIAGFDQDVTWSSTLIDVVLKNFFAAIQLGRLVVKLEQKTISADNLLEVLDGRIEVVASAATTKKAKTELEQGLRLTRHYLNALRTPVNGQPTVEQHPKLGEIKLYVTRADDAPCRVCYMRRPLILVYDRMNAHLSKYAAVFVCADKVGNEILRDFEGPEHNSWTKKVAKRDEIIAEINAFVRSRLEAFGGIDASKEHDVDDLGQYLPEDLPLGGDKIKGGVKRTDKSTDDETAAPKAKPGQIKVKAAIEVPPARAKIEQPADDDDDLEPSGTGGPDSRVPAPGPSPAPGPLPGPDPGVEDPQPAPVPSDHGRRRFLRDADLSVRSYYSDGLTHLLLRSTRTGRASLVINAIAEDSRKYAIDIAEVIDIETGEALKAIGSRIQTIQWKKDQRRHLTIRTDPPRRLAIVVGVADV